MWIIIFFILGTLFGSFWSVLLYRLDKNCSRHTIKSILIGRSHDTHTQKTLKRYQLIPIISRLIQWGKSTHTKKRLPTLYLRLEIGSGLVFALTYSILSYYGFINLYTWQWIDILTFWLTTNRLLTLLALRDIETLTLHMPMRRITCIRVLWVSVLWQWFPFYYSIITVIIIVWIFLIIYYGAKHYAQHKYQQDEGFGEWDIWLAWIMGWLLPFTLIYHNIGLSVFTLTYLIICYITISSVIAIILYVIQTLAQKDTKKQEMPVVAFFPAMIIGLRTILLTFNIFYT